VTFENSTRLVEIVAGVPLESLLMETDCPYLTPHPHRGERNEPAYIPFIAQRVAEIAGVEPDAVAEATTANAARLFGAQIAQAGE
jgi:TatD DNase family protein